MIYFSSDLHIGHANIIKYCNRPFKDVDEMNDTLLRNINDTCSRHDTLYHLGDFSFKRKPNQIEEIIIPKLIHIKGNHDREEWLDFAMIRLDDYACFLIHDKPGTVAGIPDYADLVLCGHRHNEWKYKTYARSIGENTFQIIPIINVGVENWNYKPVSKNKILSFAQEIVNIKIAEEKIKNPSVNILEF